MPESIVAEFDAAVIFSAAITFIAEIIRARVPVVYFTGALTELGRSYFEYNGLEVAGNVDELIQKLAYLLGAQAPSARETALRKAELFMEKFIDPAHRSFASVLEEVLGYKLEDAARLSSV